MPFTRDPGAQNSYDSNSTNQSFSTSTGGTLSNDMETVTGSADCTIVLPPAPFAGQRHRVMADGGTVTLSGGANLLLGGPYAIATGGSIDVTFDPEGHWIVNAVGSPGSVSSSQFIWYLDPSNVTGLASDTNDGATPQTPLLTTDEFGRRTTVLNPNNDISLPEGSTTYLVNLMSDVPNTNSYQPSFLVKQAPTDLNVGFGSDQGVLITFLGTESVVVPTGTAPAPTVATAGQTNDTPNSLSFLTSTGVADFTPYIGKMVRVTSGALAGTSAIIVDAPGPNACELGDWFGFNVGFGAPSPGDTFEIVDWTQWAPDIAFSAPSGVEIDFKNVVVPDAAFVRPPVGGGSLFFIESRLETDPQPTTGSDTNFGLIHSALLKDPGTHFFEANGTVTFILGSVIINASILSHETTTAIVFGLLISGGSWFTDLVKNPGGNISVYDFGPPGLGLGIVNWTDPGPALTLARGARMTLQGTLWGFGPGLFLDVNSGGDLDVIDGFGNPIGTALAQEIHLEHQPPNADNTAISALVGGAGVPAASALTTWAQWAAAPFNGNVMSYLTGARINTVPIIFHP